MEGHSDERVERVRKLKEKLSYDCQCAMDIVCGYEDIRESAYAIAFVMGFNEWLKEPNRFFLCEVVDTSEPHNNIYRLNNDYIDCMIHSKRNLVMQIARTIDSYNSLVGCFLSTKTQSTISVRTL